MGDDAMMSEAVSYRWENKEYLLKTIMNQLSLIHI